MKKTTNFGTKKVLITGIDGFTGYHLSKHLESRGYKIFGTTIENSTSSNIYRCDIRDFDKLKEILTETKPNYVIHLGAISFVDSRDRTLFYDVNSIGSENILKALVELKSQIDLKKVLLASSATVYGNQKSELLVESMCPKPINHYGLSKFVMEQIASNYFQHLPIIVVRPFNYTGPKQSPNFLIPKIVSHYKREAPTIELGNLNVSREFNDVRTVVEIYKRILESSFHGGVVNISSNRPIKLLNIIDTMNIIAKYEIKVEVNPLLIRKNEIMSLSGSTDKLKSIIELPKIYTLKETLESIYYYK
jgi:nucleoside-diphosphate-sugar epimerase